MTVHSNDNNASTYNWFEVWFDYSAQPPYLLMLFGDAAKDAFDVYDPGEKRIVHSTQSYEDAMFWLTEDEYTRVDGRMTLD